MHLTKHSKHNVFQLLHEASYNVLDHKSHEQKKHSSIFAICDCGCANAIALFAMLDECILGEDFQVCRLKMLSNVKLIKLLVSKAHLVALRQVILYLLVYILDLSWE